MTYIDAKKFKNKKGKEYLRIVERVNGKRIFKTDKMKYVGYREDENGPYKSIHGKKYNKIEAYGNSKKLDDIIKNEGIHLYEYQYWCDDNSNNENANNSYDADDLNHIHSYLYENYKNAPVPDLNICYFDIEVDIDPELGFPKVEEPDKDIDELCYYGEIISISMFFNWIDEMITLCRYPSSISDKNAAEEILKSIPNVFVYDKETDLLDDFLKCIEDADILTGWNSEKFDLPYLIGRTEKVLCDEEYLKRFCLYNAAEGWNYVPCRKTKNQYGKKFYIYELSGRIHLDYLNLYRKYNQQQMQSYRLDFIGEKEINMTKVPYEGSLHDLYNNSYKKFIEYNRRDVEILVGLDKKLKYIELVNQIAHKNCVLIPVALGSVALIERAIINEIYDNNLIFDIKRKKTNKKYEKNNNDLGEDNSDEENNNNDYVAGAYVNEPKEGMHNFIGCVDINSLYPSIIRTLNMGPETIVAQLVPTYTEEYLKNKIDEIKKEKEERKKKRKEKEKEGFKASFDVLEILENNATENNKTKEKEKNNLATEEDRNLLTIVARDLFGTLEYQKVIDRTDDIITVEFEKPEKFTIEMKAKEIYDLVFSENSGLCISANGTIFSKTEKSIISKLLGKWYEERKTMRDIAKDYFKLSVSGELCLEYLSQMLTEEELLWFLENIID